MRQRGFVRGVLTGIALLFVLAIASDLLLRAELRAMPEREAVAPPVNPVGRQRADVYTGRDWSDQYWQEMDDCDVMGWHSYVYFRRKPFQGTYVRVDERGLRHTWNPDGQGPRPRVFVFGGSALWGTGARDEYSIPSLLSKRLAAEGVPCDVVNYGESGWVSLQEVVMLVREIADGRVPDVAVFFDGFNDLISTQQLGAAGLPMNEMRRVADFNLSRSRSRLWDACLAKTFEGWGGFLARVRGSRPAHDTDGDALATDPEWIADETVRAWLGALRVARGLGAQHGFDTLFYRQPVLATRTVPTHYERTLLDITSPEALAVAHAFSARVESDPGLAALDGFHDLGALLDDLPESMYIDFVHMGEDANAAIAQRIAADIVPILAARR
jgi:lysophospholipase L1-like esterase